MSIEETMQGRWCLLVEEEPYSTEGRTLLIFRDGMVMDRDGVISPYRVEGNMLIVQLAEQVTLEVNPGGADGPEPPREVAIDAGNVNANVFTSFDDGSDDLIEYATLLREDD